MILYICYSLCLYIHRETLYCNMRHTQDLFIDRSDWIVLNCTCRPTSLAERSRADQLFFILSLPFFYFFLLISLLFLCDASDDEQFADVIGISNMINYNRREYSTWIIVKVDNSFPTLIYIKQFFIGYFFNFSNNYIFSWLYLKIVVRFVKH